MAGRRWAVRKFVGAVAALALIATACSGSGDDGDAGTTTGAPTNTSPAVEDVAPDLAFLGDLAEIRSMPVTATFDTSGGSLALSEEAILEVPPTAFSAATQLTAAVIDLAFENYAENAPAATIYRVSAAATEAELARPVVLEVAISPDQVTVGEYVDGQWQRLDLAAGESSRIEISHFSDVTIAVVERSDKPTVINEPADPQAQAAGDYLRACIPTVAWLLEDSGAAVDLAFSFCVRGLIDNFSPAGVRVEVGCVGGQMEGGANLQQAIDACAAEGAKGSDETGNEPAPTGPASAPEPSAPTDEVAPEAAEDFPRTYRGGGTVYLTDFLYDVPKTCRIDGPMELTLAADGTATFTYSNGVGINATLSDGGPPQIDCEPRPGNTWTGTYDAGLSTFELLPPTAEGLEGWDIGGIYDAHSADVLGGYSLPPNQAGQQRIFEIEASLTD